MISEYFGYLATVLNVERERGKHQPYDVEEVDTKIPLVSNGESLKRKHPVVKIEVEDDGKTLKSADVIARSKEELERIMDSIKEKYDTPGNSRMFEECHPGPTDTKHDFVFDTDLIRRAILLGDWSSKQRAVADPPQESSLCSDELFRGPFSHRKLPC